MNELESGKQRDLETVTTEIKTIFAQTRTTVLVNIIEIGRRLYEAKEMLQHGEWGVWLKDEFNLSQSSANNFMRLFDEYGDRQIGLFGAELNSQAFGNLTYTKALKLIAIPEDEREDFVHDNDVENISTRELDRLIKERDEAVARAEEAEKLQTEIENIRSEAENFKQNAALAVERERKLQSDMNDIAEKLKKAKASEKEAKEKIKDMKANPEISPELMEQIRSEAEEKATAKAAETAEKQLDEINAELRKAAEEKEKAEAAAIAAEKQLAEMQSRVKMSNAEVTEFKVIFEQVQDCMTKLYDILEKIEDDKLAEKLNTAVQAFLGQYVQNENEVI